MDKIIVVIVFLLMVISCRNNLQTESNIHNLPKQVDKSDLPANKQNDMELPVFVGKMKFYEGEGGDSPPKNLRVYSSIYKKDKARFIYYELPLKPKISGQTATVILEHTYYNPTGSVFCNDKNPIPVDDTVTSGYSACGARNGHWQSGIYTVVLKINGQEVAKEAFTIEE